MFIAGQMTSYIYIVNLNDQSCIYIDDPNLKGPARSMLPYLEVILKYTWLFEGEAGQIYINS